MAFARSRVRMGGWGRGRGSCMRGLREGVGLALILDRSMVLGERSFVFLRFGIAMARTGKGVFFGEDGIGNVKG